MLVNGVVAHRSYFHYRDERPAGLALGHRSGTLVAHLQHRQTYTCSVERTAARIAVVQFPGTNCERETVRALRATVECPVDLIWHKDRFPDVGYAAVVLPGGFAHGDHLRAGAIARFSPVMRGIERFAHQGGLVLGICNGFQVLLEAGLLPGAMLRNASLQFRSEWVYCRVERTDTPFTCAYQRGQVIKLPIAHGEGNYVALGGSDIVLRYCDAEGNVTQAANPNGSQDNIAGVINRTGNVFGLMPHPERANEPLLGSVDGRLLFTSLARVVRAPALAGPAPAWL
jgi:phosphoribosylformylglycinamidine synthase I